MKKSILTLICLIATIGISQAQLFPTFKVGLKGGLGFSSLRSDGGYLSSDTRTGFQIGAWGRIGMLGFHLQPEAYYASKKVGVQPEGGDDGSATFKSFDVPILLGTRIGIGPIGARIQAGPVFSFGQNDDISFTKPSAWGDYKKSSTGLIGGVGLDISKFTVDLRYEHGLTNLAENSEYDQKIKMWTVGVGFSFL